MPAIKDIIEREKTNTGKIFLYKEGIFYKAYERSAYAWIRNVCEYEVKRRYVKTIGCEIVYIGFPTNIVSQRLSDYSYSIEDNKVEINLEDFIVNEPEFELWKSGVSRKESRQLSETDDVTGADRIMQEIMRFPIETSTPMECMMFLSELKKLCSKNGSIY